MPLASKLTLIAAPTLIAASGAAAGVVDISQSPLAQSVPVGAAVNVKVVVSSPDPGGQPWDSMEVIVTWDIAHLKLVGSTQADAGVPFLLTGFLPDPDGVNSNIADGDAIFTALGLPGQMILAPQAPDELVVTTLQFLAIAPTPATPVDFLPTIGLFGQTRVLLAGFDVTGDADAVAVVEITVACPPSDHNCFSLGTPGCSDEACCETVCAVDRACCDLAWDAFCVDEAVAACDGCGDPEAGECCAAHDGPYCDNRLCCDQVCALDPFCCETEWDELCVAETLLVPDCGCDPCEASDDSCFEAHAAPGCDDGTCCTAVCALDSFCCETSWDDLCKDEANELCGGCGHPDAGSCFCAHDGTGCDGAACCRTVCELDPFCCEVQWDAVCADEAEANCGCRFDFDGDGMVDGSDLGLLLGAWGADLCPYDADHSGEVDGGDLGLLLSEWGPCR